MTIVDAHMHFGDRHPDLLSLLEELDIKLFNICVAHEFMPNWRAYAARYSALSKEYPSRFSWCTSFDPPRFDDPDYVQNVLDDLDRDFEDGAIACKVWKDLGMEVKRPDGSFFMVDDPLLDPVFDHIAQADRTLLMHIAEPLACWLPLDENSPHYGYFSENPEWHMYYRPEYPSHQRLIAARDHVVEKHPNLRIVGAHLGSLEYDVDEVAARFDRCPNFAVDISARLGDLAIQDSEKVRQFFVKYPDRILFGTDVMMSQDLSAMADAERSQELASLRHSYQTHFAYFESEKIVKVQNREIQGLGLSPALLEKFYTTNTQMWYPGL